MTDEPQVLPPAPVGPSPNVGTSAQFNDARADTFQRMGAMRAKGFTWDDINGVLAGKRQEMLAKGFNDDDVNGVMGLTRGEDLQKSLETWTQGHLAAKPIAGVADPGEAFNQALMSSSGGLISHSLLGTGLATKNLPPDAGFATRLAYNAGVMLGDIPAMVAGYIGGKAAGAVGGAAIGGVGAAVGGEIGGNAGAFMLPEAIKQTYAEALTKGEVQGPGDFMERLGGVLWNTAKQGVVGAAMGAAGAATGAVLPATTGALTRMATKTSAELATLTTAGAAVQGQLPTSRDLIDNAVLLGTFHGVAKGVSAVHTTAANLLSHWALTDQKPIDAVREAYNDPTLRQQLTVPQPPEPPEGSSSTPTPDGAFVVPHDPAFDGAPEPRVFDPSDPLHHAARALEAAGMNMETAEATLRTEGLKRAAEPEMAAVLQKAADLLAPPEGTLTAPDAARLVDTSWAAETAPSFWARIKRDASAIYREMIDPAHPINQIADRIIKGGGDLAEAMKPLWMRRAAELSGGTAKYFVEHGQIDFNTRERTGPALMDILAPFKDEVGPTTFQNYLLSRRVLAEAVRGNETGVRVDAANMFVRENAARYEDAFRQVMDWRNSLLTYSKDAGLVHQNVYNHLLEHGEEMLPIYRQEAAGAPEHAKAGEGAGRTGADPLKETKGSELPILSVYGNLMKDAFRRTQLADANAANLALADAAEKAGMGVRVRENDFTRGKDPSPDDVDGAGRTRMDGDNPDQLGTAPLREMLQNNGWTFGSDMVPIFREGKVEMWRFEDPALTQFLKGYDRQQMATWQRWIAGVTRFQRNMIVLQPLFSPKIWLYDVPWQFITKPGMRNVIADNLVGMRSFFDQAAHQEGWDRWLRSGGAESVFGHLDQNTYIKSMLRDAGDPAYTKGIWNVVDNGYRALQAWGSMITSFQRAGRFIRGTEQDESVREAAAASTDAAFHRAGFGGPAAQNLNALHPFFAAYVNGLNQTFKSMLGIGRTITGQDYNAFSTMAKGTAIITIPVLANWYTNRDEEWYKRAPDWQKDAGIVTEHGFIPLPPVLNFFFGALPRRLMEAFVADNPHALEGIFGSAAMSLVPPIGTAVEANVFQPVLEKLADYSFFRGHPLNSQATEGMEPAERWSPYSTETAKGIAKFFSDVPLLKGANMTPPEVDNFIQSWGGTLGNFAVRGTELALQRAGVANKNAPAMSFLDLPGLSSFTTRDPNASSQPVLDFDRRWADSQKVHGSLNRLLQEGDAKGYQQMLADNPAAAVLHHGAAKDLIRPDAEYTPFRAAMGQTQNAMRGKEQQIGTVQAVSKALTALHHETRLITMMPVDEPLTPLQQRTMAQIAKDVGGVAKPSMSANDKRQILDMAFSTMQRVAERGNAVMDQLKMK